MALYDNPPHSVDVYMPAGSSKDTGGGVKLNWTLVQSGLACSIETASAGEIATYARRQKVINYKVGIKSSSLAVALVPGFKLQTDDDVVWYLVQGFSSPNRQYGGIAPLSYAYCLEIQPGRSS